MNIKSLLIVPAILQLACLSAIAIPATPATSTPPTSPSPVNDNLGPWITSLSISPTTILPGGLVTFTVSAEDPNGIGSIVNDIKYPGISYTLRPNWNLGGATSGIQTFSNSIDHGISPTILGEYIIESIRAVDSLSNVSTYYPNGTVTNAKQGTHSLVIPTITVSSSLQDTTAPSIPANLSAVAISPSQINLSWTGSTDNVGVAGYKIYRDGTQIAIVTSATSTLYSYLDTGLQASATHTYAVAAYDVAGNVSVHSGQVSATTKSSSSITHTLLTSGNDSTDNNIYTTASIAPAPNTLITIAISENDPNAISTRIASISGGGVPSWDFAGYETVGGDGSTTPQRIYIYRAMSSSVGSSPITFTFTGQVKNAQWIVSQWGGVDTSGTNGSGAIATTMSTNRRNTTDTSNWNMGTLPAFSNPNDVNYSVFGVNANSVVFMPGIGFTKIDEQFSGEASEPSYLEAQWMANNVNVSASWGSPLNVGVEMLKLKAAQQ